MGGAAGAGGGAGMGGGSGAGAGGAAGAGAGGGAGSGTVCVPRYEVEPDPVDATDALVAAMSAASKDPVKDVDGQVRVHLKKGTYALRQVQVASYVRFELDPGTVLRPKQGYAPPTKGFWGMFQLGAADAAVHGVTFTEGDGCGGHGLPVPPGAPGFEDVKPTSTGFRGNVPGATPHGTRGMANAPIPANAFWKDPLARMWVVDLDPRRTGADPKGAAFLVQNGYDLRFEYLFSIQNAEEQPGPIGGEVQGATSQSTVFMILPPKGAPVVADADMQIAHGLRVSYHYNILSPSGWGPNQIRGCVDCSFDHVYSHGGTALRVETDGIPTTCGGVKCDCASPGAVFASYSKVKGLVAHHIEGELGNNVFAATPHCLASDDLTVSELRGRMMAHLAAIAKPEAAGGFKSIQVTNVEGCGGPEAWAQKADPKNNAYTLQSPQPAIVVAPGVSVAFHGVLAWPSTKSGSPFALVDGNPPPGDFSLVDLPGCPAPWP